MKNQFTRGYTKEEDDFIIANHGTLNYATIGEKLGRPRESVRGRARKYLKLESLRKDLSSWTIQEIEHLIDNYGHDHSIHKTLGRTKQAIASKAMELGITKVGFGVTDLNHRYFDTWSSNMAYIVGFFAADGNMSKRSDKESYTITFTQAERYILEDIGKELNYKGSIREHSGYSKLPQGGEVYATRYDLCITSKYIFDRLKELGFTPRKSYTLGKLNIPNKYFRYFLRGVIDGDGYITNTGTFRVGIIGRYNFLHWISRTLKKLAPLPDGKMIGKTSGICKELRYTKSASLALCKWMYDGEETIGLTRKRDKYLSMDSDKAKAYTITRKEHN